MPKEAAFVDDSPYHGVQGAKAAVMKTVWLRERPQTVTVSDGIIVELSELRRALEAL